MAFAAGHCGQQPVVEVWLLAADPDLRQDYLLCVSTDC
jgi:hypothetical protein